jgi:YegS/Rv2252/BmrU family lipid kinase
LIPEIERILFQPQEEKSFQLVQTERPWHAAELARKAIGDGYDVVVAAGGDGTANEVLNGVMDAKLKDGKTASMGILPVGRGNDFAFGMGVPAGLEASCKTLLEGHRRRVDIGHVVGGDFPQGRYFGNGVGVGFDAVVGFVALKMTRLSGFPSYIVAALKTIFLYYHAPLVRVQYDQTSLEMPALMVSIMNGQRMGGGFMMAPEASTQDGLFDVCIAREVSQMRILTLIPHFLRGTQATQPSIKMARARRLTITAVTGSLPAHADGETLCTAGESLECELLADQIDMLCQPKGSSA